MNAVHPAPVTLIRGGRLLDPAAGIDEKRDLLLRDGRVAEVAARIHLSPEDAARAVILDTTGLVVAPGLIDIHVHLREPGQTHKETIATGTAAAAAGGFTAVAAMPNTVPTNDTQEITRWMQSPDRNASARVFPIAAATRHGLPVIQHAEDTRLTDGASMNAGPVAFRLGLRGMPPEAEYGLVERDIRLVAELARDSKTARPHLHVAHTSTAQAVAAVHQARRNGLHVTCEVAPHHFLLTEHHVGCYNTHAKMNPPLRSEADRDAMIQGILDGVVDAIATDHAPHAAHEKEVEFERAPNGITGLETALGLCLRWLHGEWHLPLSRVLSLLSAQPAALLGFKGRGTLTVGSFADVIVFDPDAEWTWQAAHSRSRSRNSPFDGWTLRGRIRHTLSEGHLVYSA